VLLSLFVAVYLYRHARGRRWLYPAVALTVAGALSLAAYAYAALVVRGHDLAAAVRWVATAQHGFVSPGGPYRLADAIYGLAKSLVFAPYLYEADAQKLIGQFLLGLIPLGALFVAALSGRATLRKLDGNALLVWTAPYAVVGVAFFGADPERWIFLLPAGWIVAAALILDRTRPPRAAVAVLAWIGLFNLGTAIWSAHRDQWPRQKAEATAALLGDGDLIVFPGHSWDEYIVYYGKARVEPFPISYYAARDGVAAGWARLDREMAAARARGGRVFCARLFDDGDEDPRGFWELGSAGLTRAALKARVQQSATAVTLQPMPGFTVTRLDP
jgi:hypothetical protein